MRRIVSLLLVLVLCGCKVGPNYRRPKICLPEAWDQPVEGVASGERPEVEWWKRFNDPILDWLISCALRNNLDIAEARARIREARALYQIAAGKLLPNVNGDVEASRERFSANSQPGGVPGDLRFLIVPNWAVGFDASWEIDVFGKIRRGVEAACADLNAARAEGSDVVVTLLGELGRNYVQLRGFQKRVDVAMKNIAVLKDVASIAKIRYEAGLANSIDYLDASSLAYRAEAILPRFEEGIYEAIYRLSVLLGLEANALTERLVEHEPMPLVPMEIPIGTPSELLCNRPDVVQAEWEVRAAMARVGEAIGELYPSLTLDSLFEVTSVKPSSLFDWMSRMWFISGSVIQPIFTGWQIRGHVKEAWAFYWQTVAAYRRTILEATEEVRNALVTFTQERERYHKLYTAMEDSSQSRLLSLELYTKGLVNFLFVLNAEQAVTVIDDELVETETRFVESAVALYKAMGGCWEI